jgi:xanthine dehydrogenase YagR molybdenum-binding subunit
VIGLGEPPTVSPGAAIANAVANAIGVRVGTIPMTPDKVLAALARKGGSNAKV